MVNTLCYSNHGIVHIQLLVQNGMDTKFPQPTCMTRAYWPCLNNTIHNASYAYVPSFMVLTGIEQLLSVKGFHRQN